MTIVCLEAAPLAKHMRASSNLQCQLTLLTKAHAVLTTCVWFLFRMISKVFIQLAIVTKALAAVAACVWLFICVS